MENQELKIVNADISVLTNKDTFEHGQRVAKLLASSQLVPKDYQNNISNCVVALEMAQRIGASPLMVMQNLYIVHGRPAWSSQFLIATLNASGQFSPLRYEEDEQDGGRCRAYAQDKNTGENLFGAWVTMKMAESEGWISKSGSKWKTMPQLMRRYRAAAFFTRQFAPEISMGIHTYEEAQDVTPIKSVSINKEMERIEYMIRDCETIEELKQVEPFITNDEMAEMYNQRLDEINQKGRQDGAD